MQKIAYMRSLDADSLLFFATNPLAGGAVQMNWQPVVDKVVFDDSPTQIFQSGFFNKVPLMIGSNSEEMSLSAPQTVLPFMVTALINSTVSSDPRVRKKMELERKESLNLALQNN